MKLALIVPVLNRFDLFTEMMESVDVEVRPFVIDSWRNNIGVAAAWNVGMRRALEAGYEVALITNDDVVFEPGAIESMYNLITTHDVVMVSANQNGSRGSGDPIPGADFFCFMVNIPKLTERCGWFDENIHPAYFEDNDMHRRMILAGQDGLVDTTHIVKHHGSATQNADPEAPIVPPFIFCMNRDYFVSKWGGEPGKETFIYPYNNPNISIKDWHGQA